MIYKSSSTTKNSNTHNSLLPTIMGSMGTLYHERQESKLCALHCVNAVLQAPAFSEFDLAAMASDLDRAERQMMLDSASGDFLPEASHNVSRNGDFSIQVLTKALEVWNLQIIHLDSPMAQAAQRNPDVENAYICNLRNHWFCLRKVDDEWYNFDSMYVAPEHLSKFYLSAYLDSLKGSGWSIFLVRGDFPKECPASESNGYGRWLTPEDAKRIIISASRKRDRAGRRRHRFDPPTRIERKRIVLSDDEDDDGALKDAIAASLRESSAADEKQPDSSENENVEKDEEKIAVLKVDGGP